MKSLYTDELPTKLSAQQRWKQFLDRVTLRGPDFSTRRKAIRSTFITLLGLSAVFGALSGLTLIYSIDLPQMDELERYRPNTTTDLLDIHGRLIGSFAQERRVVVPYSDLPVNLREAILSIEDKSFESNWGVNPLRTLAAAYTDIQSKGRAQGASTLTMQLTRNLFLSSQKTFGRKLQEIFLSLQIERRFTKQQIFSLYANQIYLGHGTYGFEAGAEFYFSKHVKDLTLPECALLAALPKGPEAYSPIKYPDRALRRRNLVLSEMLEDHKITQAQADAARDAPLGLNIQTPPNSLAPYFVEEVRRQLEKEYGVEEVHGAGLKVYTTLDLDLQQVANHAVLNGVAAYERRHGWKGRLQNVIDAGLDPVAYQHPDWTQTVAAGDYIHAMVTQIAVRQMTVRFGTQTATIAGDDWAWAQQYDGRKLVRVGDLVYIRIEHLGDKDGVAKASLQQDSGAQGSMMAIDNSSGEVMAMVGGRDYALSQFNRATQAQRQVGSSFKPYVYTAAIEAGAKPMDPIVDAPTTFSTPSGPYTPRNYEHNYAGSMTLADAFAQSRNIPALRLADRVGIRKVIEVAHRFGITSKMPMFLPVAIGSADITLAEQVGAYTVFPNDGLRIAPHYIRKVTQADGIPLDEKKPEVTEVISVETARSMMVLLKAVVQYGTGAAASSLGHPFGGKTGTTNDFTDAWFIGFSPSVTCGTWIGFDDRTSLGKGEQGAKAALPMWMEFMKAAIADRPDEYFPKDGAPKKVLAVPVTPAGQGDTPSLNEQDETAPGGQVVVPTAPTVNGVPTAPTGSKPAVETPERTGVAHPPPA
ncbi:PBP1A family penicillin-binding protein [Granulicella sp. WH15]|uniref:penicillin-binding protein 1A n=1 Tax=Granulicella sp. WH15 TaxID=2602070 RepID=UPI00136750C9|nr:PBP1A family penicillin-binding protein [Granulicella sp. WH15]QHN02188.1 PBP1A family penicillin-binding protein [Granulicella sp. WH15]